MQLTNRPLRIGSRRLLKFVVWLTGVVLVGCSTWDTSPSHETTFLPRAKMSRDTVVLEMQTVAIPEASSDVELDRLWNELDEQHLNRDLRRGLAENGMRCGLLGTQMPELLRQILNAQSNSSQDRWEQMESLPDNPIGHRRLQARAHKRYEIVASPSLASCVVLTSQNGRLAGQTLYDAQCRFALRNYPRGDGNVRLELTPEIHHGPLQQKWTGSDGAFQPIVSRQKEIFEQLRIDAVLSPGEILLLTATNEPKGVGALFFTDLSRPSASRGKMLLVRLAQTQLDDLFDDDVIATPIATSERQQ